MSLINKLHKKNQEAIKRAIDVHLEEEHKKAEEAKKKRRAETEYYRTTSKMQIIDYGEPLMLWFRAGENGHKGSTYGIAVSPDDMKKFGNKLKNKLKKDMKEGRA